MKSQLVHLPGNPFGKYLVNIGFDLLTEDGQCLHNISRSRPNGNCYIDTLTLTAEGVQLRDDLLSIPGLTELAFYQNWMSKKREVFIGFSETVTWEQLWQHIQPYLTLREADAPAQKVKDLLGLAKVALGAPLIGIKLCPNERYFQVICRQVINAGLYRPFYYKGDLRIASNGSLPADLIPVLRALANADGVICINVGELNISVEVLPAQREGLTKRFAPLIGAALFPGREFQVRTILTAIPQSSFDDQDGWGWDDIDVQKPAVPRCPPVFDSHDDDSLLDLKNYVGGPQRQRLGVNRGKRY